MGKLERIRAICEADPTNTFARYSLAMELKKTDVKAALDAFEKLRADYPAYVPLYYHFAQTLGDSGDTARAVAICDEGVAVARAAGDGHAAGELAELRQRYV